MRISRLLRQTTKGLSNCKQLQSSSFSHSLRAAPKKGAVVMEANFILNIYKDREEPVKPLLYIKNKPKGNKRWQSLPWMAVSFDCPNRISRRTNQWIYISIWTRFCKALANEGFTEKAKEKSYEKNNDIQKL